MNNTFYHLRPKLDEILDDRAPFPHTLSAFISFLSKNHCLEILEFILEARHYRHSFQWLDRSVLCQQWERLLQMHIVQGAPREINIPDTIRDNLLAGSLESRRVDDGDERIPPDPSLLDPAVQQMHELLNDSILLRFLRSSRSPESVRPLSTSCLNANGTTDPKDHSGDTCSEHQRRTAAEIFPYSPAPSREESQSQSQSPGSRSQRSWSTTLTGSQPPSVVFSDEKPVASRSSISKRGSVSSGARSMRTSSDGHREFELTRTKSTPTREAEAEANGRKKRWHRIGIFKHLRRSSSG